MNRQAFSLIELLIVVAIISILVGVAMPYYQDYVKNTRITKAKYELGILKEALIKYDTFERKAFVSNDLRLLVGRYLQEITRDPWGRDYETDYLKGYVRSLGSDHLADYDDIIVDYKPVLMLQKATWIDYDNNHIPSEGDLLRLEFSRFLATDSAKAGATPLPGSSFIFGNSSDTANASLWFSEDVKIADIKAIATWTEAPNASTTEILFELLSTTSSSTFFVGSSTVGVALGNNMLVDYQERFSAGTRDEFSTLPVVIQGR